ncbi:thioredoxin family protein [Chryseobacterium koreense]|uniref:Thioredoxin n=1 Tax=Chryseobacterium koreense CCUG 49689 TaxID=1304281 RepID=A0A0J7J343_9FLAO|nr:thioredoxin fold domain-containing protein [Chryseobacterium koreense]KMQ72632.1 thioredoxin [Chryseobacterium koreense CCUG 49689]MBB5333026.1 thioredoxin-related protein [Chryseobacterium koreense]
MSKVFLIISVLISSFFFSQVKWMTMEEALKAQETKPKKIIIDFYADWCGPCKTMEKYTYNHPEISAYLNENYYPVKFNAEGNQVFTIYGRTFGNPDFVSGKKKNSMHDFSKFMNVNAVPSMVFLDEQNMPITIINGFLTAKEIDPYLRIISTNDYKKFKSREEWDNSQKKMKSNIKD